MAEDVSVVMHDPNTKNISLFLMVMSIAMLASKTGDYMNLCIPLFEAKYGWETQAQKDLNESLMNTIPAFGTIFGSGAASSLMVHGRAKAFIISCFIGIGASLFPLHFHSEFYCLSNRQVHRWHLNRNDGCYCSPIH